MIEHTFKLILRNLIRDRQFALLNLLGLALAFVAFFLAVQYASFEMSYDGFHENKDGIYRVAHHEVDGDNQYHGAMSFYGIGPQAMAEIPEVLDFVRLHRADGMVTWVNDQRETTSYHETNAYYADPSFFDIFSCPLVKGAGAQLLQNPNAVIISASTARKYFGSEDPIGKTLSLVTEWKGGNYTVEGVFQDLPVNSHLSFDFIFPITELLNNFQFEGRGWYWINFYTYFLLKPDSDMKKVNTALTKMVDEHIGETFHTPNYALSMELQPLTSINLHSDLQGEIKPAKKWGSIRTFLGAAFFAMILAWLNYINLATARAARRAREIGLKKAIGASKYSLVAQFLIESVMTNLIAVVLATLLLAVFLPHFEVWFGISLNFDWNLQYAYWLLFLSLFIVGMLVSSLYPAHHLSSLKTVATLKGQFSERGRSALLRKVMMMVQFALSLLLLIGTTIIYQQISLMKTRDLGMEIADKLVIKAPRETQKGYWRSLDNYKEEMLKHPFFTHAAVSFDVPGRPLFWGAAFDVKGGRQGISASRTSFDYDFIAAYGIALLAGKNFADRFEGQVVVINEAASEVLGFDAPMAAIGHKIHDGWVERRIIGVMENYHHQSPKFKVRPLVVSPFAKEQGYITLNLSTTEYMEALSQAQELFGSMFPENAFECFFLEEYFNQQYQSDNQFRNLLVTFTSLSVLISLLGLVGFASFVSVSRTREVGIRKVLGASSSSILLLFNHEIAKLIVLAFFLASPLIYWITNSWLDNYANRVNLSMYYFLIPMLVILLMAVTTVSLHVFRLSKSNPVSMIRTE